MFTKRSAINLVKKFAEEIAATGIHLHKVILFGSYAKARQNPYSDIDVALISDSFIGVGFEDVKYFAAISIKKPYLLIEPKTYSITDFEKGDPFIEEIMKSGVEIKLDYTKS